MTPRKGNRMYSKCLALLGLVMAVSATRCGADSAPPEPAVTYQNAIRAVLEDNCVTCHQAGGIGPFQLNDWDEVSFRGETIVELVTSGTMPPWQPADDCRPMAGERRLSETQKTLFAEWEASGFAFGDPADYEASESALDVPDSRGEPSLTLRSEAPYQPDPERPDDYRCFLLDHDFEGPAFLTAFDILPDQVSMVHHVLLYEVTAADLDGIRAHDAQDDAPGYTCFGGPGVTNTATLAGWVPGTLGTVMGPERAVVVRPGSRIVMQVHYNFVNVDTRQDIPTDWTQAALWLLPEGAAPAEEVIMMPFAELGLYVAAGNPNGMIERAFEFPYDATLIGIMPHMHTLGSRIQGELIRGDDADAESTCLVNIPDWDFNWQQTYFYAEGHEVAIAAGDTFRSTCVYDNSPANQPIVNGERTAPRDVTWGEGTLDEMCLQYAILAVPYGEPRRECGDVDGCVRQCDNDDFVCALDCTLGFGANCTFCFIPGMSDCVARECPLQGLEMLTCMRECGDEFTCPRTDCLAQANAMWECLEPSLSAGVCNDDIGGCGIAF